MKNNRGFTLIEIIVSLALLSIISVGMISGLTSQFRFLTGTRNFTEELSGAQLRMEGEIVAVKKTLEAHGTPSGETDYTLFSGAYERTVAGYPRELVVDLGTSTGSFFTVVGSRVLEFPVATATVGIKFQPIDTTLFEYSPSLYASSTVNLVDPTGVNLTNIYRWYVSREGFNIPMLTASTPEEVETGTKYPRFPDDYSIVPSAPNSTLASVVSRYPGRHVLCTVTPASTSGKMGATAVSNPVFVSGLPYRSNLELHLDASLISREAAFGQVEVRSGRNYVENWADVSGEGNDAVQSSDTRQPELIETFIGDMVDAEANWFETYAKYAAFDGSNDYINTTVSGYVDTLGTYSTVFVVARDAGAEKFTIYTNDVPAGYVSFSPGYSTTSVTVGNAGSPVDVAEVIIYNAVLSADDTDDVMDYLEKKYLPVTPTVSIRWLTDVTDTVLQNSTYTPPTTVSAYMTSGRYKDVPVTWSPATIDTSTLGDKFSTCTAVADTTKHSTLTVHVVAPTPLTAIGDITASNNGTHASLSAGALSPIGATATYQWQIYTAGAWENIVGAVSSVYSSAVWGQQYRVVATGSGIYTGTVISNPITLNITPLYSIGTPLVTGGGSYAELTAGVTDPSAATVSYQWQRYSSGTWQNVTGATSSVYSYASWDSTYRVVATGIGAYSGTVESGSVTPTQVDLESIDNIAIYWDGSNYRLTAGAVSPSGATVTYQWQYYHEYYYSGEWRDISGATSSTYTATAGTTYRVKATGTGMYYGTVTSASITAEPIDLEDIDNITVSWDGANPVLTAGAITPAGATVTYQWYYYRSYYGWTRIDGATSASYTGTSGTWYFVRAIGTGMYTGYVDSDDIQTPTRDPVTAVHITYSWVGSDPILRVDSITPSSTSATYQWFSNTGTGWNSIDGATSTSYTGVPGTQYKVAATGNNMYFGTVESNVVAVPNRTPVTEVVITYTWSGTNAVLSVDSLTPSGATVTYQWWTDSGSGWSSIAGATSSTYTGASGAQYRVVVTGTGAYTGTVQSNTVVVPTREELRSVSITVTWNGATPTLTAVLDPSGATVTYQWQYYKNRWRDAGTSSSITGTEDTSYRVTVTGYGAYYGTRSAEITPQRSELTGMDPITVTISGTSPVLTAGTVYPSGATYTLQWQYRSGGSWLNITGATSSSYTGSFDTRYRVVATGTGAYKDTVSREATPTRPTLEGIGNIVVSWNGSRFVLTAGAVDPASATVSYQWYANGSVISGATSSTYSNAVAGTQYYVRVTGTGIYTGTINSASVTPGDDIESVGNPTVTIVGTSPRLTAGAVSPTGATFTYQWQSYSGGWNNITGATSATYTGAFDTRYRVSAIGTGAYYGIAYSGEVTPERPTLTSIGTPAVSWNGSRFTLTAGAIVPSGATFTYQWQSYNGSWGNITGATSSTYNTTSAGLYRVTAIGTGLYSGSTVNSDSASAGTQVNSVTINSGSPLSCSISPSSATVTYQWQRREKGWFSGWSSWENISTGSTCPFTEDTWYWDYQYQLTVTGTGQYYGTASDSYG